MFPTQPIILRSETLNWYLFQVIWEKTNSDLESVKMSIRELFYLLEMKSKTEITAIVEIFETATEIPAFVEGQYRAALLDENKTGDNPETLVFGTQY